MRIAYVYDVLYPFWKGGGERRIYEIARRLTERGHTVELFGMKCWEGPSTIQSDGLYYRALSPSIELFHRHGRRSISQALRFGAHSWRLLNAGRFDVIDCGQWPYFHFLPARIHSWFTSSSFVVSWYEVWGDHWFNYLGKSGMAGLAVERMFCKIPDRLIAVSEQTKFDLLAAGVREENVTAIPNGINYDGIRSVIPDGLRCDIVCCGRLKDHKNVDILLRAIAILKQSRPQVRAFIVGDGPAREGLFQLARDLDLLENVTFTGALDDFDDVVRVMKRAKIFINASTKEGGGSITLFEANACGLPVIAVRCPNGIDPTLIVEGENGFFVDQLSPELLAQKAQQLLENTSLLSAISDKATRMAARYDWEVIATEHEHLYEALHQARIGAQA